MTKDEALKLALEALEWSWGGEPLATKELEAIAALRQALEQPSDIDAAIKAENEACAKLIESYPIPVGNSPAGEMACEWTYAALREVCESIRARMKND